MPDDSLFNRDQFNDEGQPIGFPTGLEYPFPRIRRRMVENMELASRNDMFPSDREMMENLSNKLVADALSPQRVPRTYGRHMIKVLLRSPQNGA
jgi:hypothetical protein